MEFNKKVSLTKENIRKAIKHYWEHTDWSKDIRDEISNKFINLLAEDSVRAKMNLRNMLRKSPQWNEELDALVINGTATHDPDYARIEDLAEKILQPYEKDYESARDILAAIKYFTTPGTDENDKQKYIAAIKRLAPNAYAPGKKTSRIFKALCVALDVADETPNSEFQRNFAKIADEMSTRQIPFKLFVSINPAHFLTMSNPKGDDRGDCLTSCHSLNSTDYEYNNGCTGYARDNVTMIAFTASNPDDPATLDNRKTTRQLFMYEPGNGLLLQSRMYNTSGGTCGAQENSKVYRDLVQRQIACCENAANLWVTSNYSNNARHITLKADDDFGGYCDWEYENFAPKMSIRKDCLESFHPFTIGAAGLCLHCGDELSEGLFCDDCNDNSRCEECGETCNNEDLYRAYNEDGDEVWVCENCLDDHYRRCEDCDEYHHIDNINSVYDSSGYERYVCDDCRDRNYTQCDECGEYHEDIHDAIDAYGDDCQVCDNCIEDTYFVCRECDQLVHKDYCSTVHDEDGDEITVCNDCLDHGYSECDECGEYWPDDTMTDGLCPSCHEERLEEEKHNKESEVA